MAFAVIPNEGERYLLEWGLNSAANWHVRLYSNNITPSPTSVLADFNEATYTDYAQIDWPVTPVTTDGSGRAKVPDTLSEFVGPSAGASQDIYGWYVVHGSGTVCVLAARLAGAPKTMASVLDEIRLALAFRAYDPH